MNKFLLHITSFVVIILFLFMGACHNHPQAPMLLEVEKIIEEQPDSALSILNKIENINQLSEKDHATYCLLLTQAQDLNYITHTSDSLIKIAATYFEKSSDKQKASLSYYYMGRVNADLYDALKAQEYYLKALEVGEKTKDYHLLARICNNLGTLYNYQDIYDMALPVQKKALYYLEQVAELDSANISFVLRNIARTYVQTQQKDSAIFYFQKAMKYSTANNISSILLSLGNLHFDKGEYKEAEKYIDKALSLAINKKTLDPIYLSKGELFRITGQTDSAKIYLTISSKSPYLYTKAGSFKNLAKIALEQQNCRDYLKYSKEYELLHDSIINSSHFENIRMTQGMYNYQRINKEKNKFTFKGKNIIIPLF